MAYFWNRNAALTAHKACKILQDVTKLRSVREGLVHQAIACDPYSTPPERPIMCYSSDELECWAMRRLSVHKGWLSRNPEPARTRLLPFERAVEGRLFVKGGRWLLSACKGGEIAATDLDDNDTPRHIFITPQEDFEWSTHMMFHSNYSPNSKPLEFDLAILQRSFRTFSLYHVAILVKPDLLIRD